MHVSQRLHSSSVFWGAWMRARGVRTWTATVHTHAVVCERRASIMRKTHSQNLTCTRACFLPRITATSLAYVSLRATPLYTSKSRNNFNVTSLVCTSHSVGMFSGPQDTRNRAAVVMFDSCCLHKSTHVIDSQTRSDAHKAHGSTRPYA